ncbi:Na(+) H(+) antiporter subunit F [Vibrio sp. JCM 19052]|nr:Na(+) H(+) antiporter subunit F [Vibrio sp. JCM 19052]
MSITFAYIGLLLSVVMAFIRLVLGPTLADRVIALDLISFVTVALLPSIPWIADNNPYWILLSRSV